MQYLTCREHLRDSANHSYTMCVSGADSKPVAGGWRQSSGCHERAQTQCAVLLVFSVFGASDDRGPLACVPSYTPVVRLDFELIRLRVCSRCVYRIDTTSWRDYDREYTQVCCNMFLLKIYASRIVSYLNLNNKITDRRPCSNCRIIGDRPVLRSAGASSASHS